MATSMAAFFAATTTTSRAHPTSSSDDLYGVQKTPLIGGLSSLFATSAVKNSVAEGMGFETRRSTSNTHIDLGISDIQYVYSPPSCSSSLKLREQSSPVSVLQAPLSTPSGRSYKSKPVSFSHHHPLESDSQQNLKKWEVFSISRDIFLRSALGSCVPVSDEEFTFNLEGNFLAGTQQPYAEEMLRDAQSQHQIFKEDFVMKAFYQAEKAHRGQVRASGDPYLRHCLETSILLATIGSSEVV